MLQNTLFTSGSKLYLGTAAFGLVATVIYAVSSGNEFVGTITLLTLTVTALFLGGVTIALRDAELGTSTTTAALEAAEAGGALRGRSLVSPGPWPLLCGFGAAVLVLGLVQDGRLALLGGLTLLAGFAEWVVQAWADRASDDPVYNAGLRARIMHPVEFPLLGAVIVGFVIWGFSRVMLALPKVGSIWAFIIVASLILIVASIIALRPNISGNLATSALLVGGAAVLVGGIVGIAQGERTFERHEVSTPGEATQSVSDRAAVLDTIVFEGQAELPAQTVPRAINIGFILRNETGEVVRLVVEADERPSGPDGELLPALFRSNPVDKGREAYVGFRINKPGIYEYRVERAPEQADEAHGGEEAPAEVLATGEIVVP